MKPRRTGSPAYAGDDSECAALAGPFPNMTSHFSRRVCPSFAETVCPPKKQREQGMPGARCTRGLMCKIVRRDAHEHTGSAETLRHSPRNGFTAYAAISPATNSSCHRHRRIEGLAAPGWADETSADLTPATGARTTRFCRTRIAPSSCASDVAHGITRPAISAHTDAAASTASRPNVRDDGQRPSP